MLKLSGSIIRCPPYGKFPSVSINNDGTIVEVYQPHILSNEIYYKVGELNGEEINMNEEGSRHLDYGRYPKVAINNENRVVEVHEGRLNRYVYYHVGEIDVHNKTIFWYACVRDLSWGRSPAVAVHGNRVVVTHDCAYGSYTSYYYFGIFTVGGHGIEWREKKVKLFKTYGAAETSVAINEQNIVVAG